MKGDPIAGQDTTSGEPGYRRSAGRGTRVVHCDANVDYSVTITVRKK